MTKCSNERRVPLAHAVGSLLLLFSVAAVSLPATAASAETLVATPTPAATASASTRTPPPRSARAWGTGEATPQPGALVLASLAVVALVARRRLGQ